jgi:hypothetical protein
MTKRLRSGNPSRRQIAQSLGRETAYTNYKYALSRCLAFGYFVFFLVQSYGTFIFGTISNDGRAFYYAAEARSILHGRLNVDPSFLAGGGECFYNHGKCFGYFGIFPSVLRVPFEILGFPNSALGTGPFMLAAYFIFIYASYKIALLLRKEIESKHSAFQGIVIGLLISFSPVFFLAGREYVYEEAIMWAVAFSMLTVLMLLTYVKSMKQKYLYLGILFSLFTLHSRVSCGAATVLSSVIVIFCLAYRRNLEWKNAFRALSTCALASSTYLIINFLKFSAIEPSIVKQHGGVMSKFSRTLFYTTYPQFSLGRIPVLLLDYFFPSFNSKNFFFTHTPNNYNFHLLGLSISAKSVEQSEYFSPIGFTYIMLFTFSIIGIFKLRGKWKSEREFVLLICCFASSVLLDCSFIGATERYEADFVPFLLILAMFGFLTSSINSKLLMATVFIMGAIQIVMTYYTTLDYWKYSPDRPAEILHLLTRLPGIS